MDTKADIDKKKNEVSGLQKFFIEVSGITKFTINFFKSVLKPPYEFTEISVQSYEVGFKSLPLVTITGLIMGLVLVIQSRPTMVEFGAGSYIPAMASISIIREIGPLVTALICAGNIGSSISAELGSMKVTEQIDAMEVSGINPFRYLVVSRMVATTFMIPLLVIYADAISLIGAFLGANIKGEISFTLFYSQVFEHLEFDDVIPSIIKSFFFGFVIGLVGCYKGYTSPKGTEGVGRAVNAAVVLSLLLVILVDMIAAQIGSFLDIV